MTQLQLGRGFTLPTSYITKTGAILAKRRIGKTYNASVMAEEFVRCGLPFVALDPTSAWWGLRAAANGRDEGLPVTIIGGEHGDLPLDVGSGKVIADLVVEEPGFYIVDLGHWENDSEHRRWAAPFLDRIYRRKAKLRDPLHLFIDEADVFAPQKPLRGDEQMLHNMQAIVRRGGIRGLGTTLITQRAAVLNKDVLTQLDILFILRTIAPQDQDAVDDYIKRGAAGHRDEIMGSLASLAPGESWVYGPGEDPPVVERVQFRQRRTFNSSATPDKNELVEPKKMAPVDLEKATKRLAETIEKAKADDPAELRKIIAKLKKDLETAQSEAEPERVEVEVIKNVPTIPDGLLDAAVNNVGSLQAMASELRHMADNCESWAEWLDKAIHNPDMPPVTFSRDDRQMVSPATEHRMLNGSPPPPPRPFKPESMEEIDEVESGAMKLAEVLVRRYPMQMTKAQLATMAGRSRKSSSYGPHVRQIVKAGLAEERGGLLTATERALSAFPNVAPMEAGDIVSTWMSSLPAGPARMLSGLLERGVVGSRDELAEVAGMSPTSSGVGSALKVLKDNGLVEVHGSQVAPADFLS